MAGKFPAACGVPCVSLLDERISSQESQRYGVDVPLGVSGEVSKEKVNPLVEGAAVSCLTVGGLKSTSIVSKELMRKCTNSAGIHAEIATVYARQ